VFLSTFFLFPPSFFFFSPSFLYYLPSSLPHCLPQYWNLSSGLCKTGALPHEPYLQLKVLLSNGDNTQGREHRRVYTHTQL
jgi:hypothetical protein